MRSAAGRVSKGDGIVEGWGGWRNVCIACGVVKPRSARSWLIIWSDVMIKFMRLLIMEFPKGVTDILELFKKKGYQIFVVGGVVRDILLGRATKDWDFATDATPEQTLELLGAEAFYDNKFGTVGIKIDGFEFPFEITTFRSEEGYTDNRRPDKVVWGTSLENDLARRDFTINAIAMDESRVIDPHGGQEDLKKKLIRAVGEANDRFKEDALRMMRAVRIAAQLGFEIETRTLAAIQESAKLIKNVSGERVHDELIKIFSSDYPADGYLLLRNCGLGVEILPEVEAAFGVEQKSPGRHHIYDVGTHSVETLRHCQSRDAITRFAALLHDVGKVKTQRIYRDGRITFYNHEMESTKIAEQISDRLRFSNKERDKLVKLVRWHQFTMDEHMTDSAVRRIIRNVGLENVSDLIALRIGDRIGSGAKPTSWRFENLKERFVAVQQQPFSITDLKINGKDVMEIKGIDSGPAVGQYLQQIFEMVTEKGVENERGVLMEKLKELN
jgi:poly(A) polymerase/tRNA nucleotidyltransferase (CCA-adding enzyme)